MDLMHMKNIDDNNERDMASPFASEWAQAGQPSISPSTQPVGSPSRSHQDARHAQFSSNNLSTANGTHAEDARATPKPTSGEQLDPLSALSPFANAPPLGQSSSSSLASLAAVQSDQKSQKSSTLGTTSLQSGSSNSPLRIPDDTTAAALAAALAAATTLPGADINHQRNLPINPPSPFLNGRGSGSVAGGSTAAASVAATSIVDDMYNPLSFNIFSVPEGAREGYVSSSDISTPHFPSQVQQQQQQVQDKDQLQHQLLQHLLGIEGGSGGGGAGNASGSYELQSKTPSSSPIPIVQYHSSGIPRPARTSSGRTLSGRLSGTALSSPPSPAAAAVAAAAGGGASSAFRNIGAATTSPDFSSLGGVQLSPEQLQTAALQAMQSGQSYASRLEALGLGLGKPQSILNGIAQPQSQSLPQQQQASVAHKLMAYQQQQQPIHALPAEAVPPPLPLHLQEAALQALQHPQQPQQQQQRQAMGNPPLYSPTRRSDSWGQFRAGRSSAASTPPGGGAVDIEGMQFPFPAARYSISRDSGGGVGGGNVQRMAAVERNSNAADLLQRVRALLNTGGKFVINSSTGNLTYTGGEIRLVSLPEGCTFPQLLAVLAKTERPGLTSPSTAGGAKLKASTSTSSRAISSVATGKDTTTNSSGERNSLGTTTAAQNLTAAAAAVSALIGAQEAAANASNTSALDVESYATYAMHVARAHCLVRYQLPSDPSIFVDIVDDEDVQLLFEEIAELKHHHHHHGGGGGAKLRLFVQWIASPPGYSTLHRGSGSGILGGGGGSYPHNNSSRNNTIDYMEEQYQFLNPMYSGGLGGIDNATNSSTEEGIGLFPDSGGGGGDGEQYHSAGENYNESSTSIAERNDGTNGAENIDNLSPFAQVNASTSQQQQQVIHVAHRSASELRLAAVRSDQLECIPAFEVTLIELLGTGIFGDMYAGKWRECTVAVKCLNPSAVGLNYGSQAAWLAFLRDANSTAALRHPNLVEVYGIVLPGAQDQRSVEQEVRQRSESVDLALKAAGGVYGGYGEGGGGLMIDPKMSGRRTSWDFGALNSARSSSIPSPTAAASLAAAPAAVATFGAGIQRLPGPCMSTPAIVMEYVSGKSLHSAIKRKDDAVAGALARILYALDVSRGMAYLHHRGVSHFDLKSTNILLGWRNMRPAAKVAGYGLSTRKTSLRTYTPGVTMSPGVFPWVAPEIFRNPEKVSAKADIFSFGVVLWELWALRAPYENIDMNKLVSLAVNTDEEVRPEVPPPGSPAEPTAGWEQLVKDCWAEDPDDRPEFVEIEKRLTKMAKAVKCAQRKPEEPAAVNLKQDCEKVEAMATVLPAVEQADKEQKKEDVVAGGD